MRGWIGAASAILYGIIAAVQLVAIVNGASGVRTLTQALIMPALLCFAHAPIVVGGRDIGIPMRDRIGLTIAITLSWAGDVVPRLFTGDAAFITMLALFLLAQLGWSWELLTRFERSILARRRPFMLFYVAATAIVISACLPGAGPYSGFIPFYAAAVLGSAILATGVGAAGTIGGILFVIANSLIGLFMFVLALDPGEPLKSTLIMSAYMTGQALVVLGIRRTLRRDARAADAIIAIADADAASPPPKPVVSGGRLPPLPGPEARARSRVRS